MIYSCKGCVAPKRFPGCHSSCPDYISEKAEHDRLKAIADQKRETESGLASQRFAGVNKAYKAQRRIRGI